MAKAWSRSAGMWHNNRHSGLMAVAVVTVSLFPAAICHCIKPQPNGFHFETLNAWGKAAPPLRLKIPNGYSGHVERQWDFYLYYFIPIDSSRHIKSKATLGIYVGNFPNRFCPEGPPIVLTDTVTKTGTRFSWSSWIKVLNGDSTIISDALVDGFFDEVRAQTGNGGLDNIRIHLFVHGTDRDISRMFIRAAETLEFAPMD